MSDYSRNQDSAGKQAIFYIVGWLISIVQIVASAAAIFFLKRSNFVPQKIMIAGIVVLIILILLCRLLMKRKIRTVRFIIGAVIALLISAVLVVASFYVNTFTNTVQNITNSTEEVTRVGVYVRNDDPAQSIQDASDYVFGILDTIERSDTDNAVAQINEELGSFVQVDPYAGMDDLADALLNQECGAIVMSEQYASVISELEGYEGFEDEIREISYYEWSSSVKAPSDSGSEEAAAAEADIQNAINGYGVFTMYISGIDTFGSISTKSRSDVNIIAVVNTNTKQILLVSTPRDYYIPLSISGGAKDKLTHAGIYGVNVSMETLEMLYNIDLNYYFRINFSGFEKLIDSLGGIDVVSENTFDVAPSFHYVEGVNHLDGVSALAFARERHAFSEGDRQRGKNQMAVITGVIQKLQTTAVLNNFTGLMEGLEGSFETDMPYEDLTTLVRNQISAGGSWDIQTYSVDGTGAKASTFSMSKQLYVMNPDQSTVDYARSLIQSIQNNETISVTE